MTSSDRCNTVSEMNISELSPSELLSLLGEARRSPDNTTILLIQGGAQLQARAAEELSHRFPNLGLSEQAHAYEAVSKVAGSMLRQALAS